MSKKHPVRSYLFDATNEYRGAVLALIVMEAVLSLLHISFVLAMRHGLDGAVNRDAAAFQTGLLCMVCVIVLRIVLRALLRHLQEKVRSGVENNLKGRLLHHLLHNNYARTEAVHTGEWMNRLTSDTVITANGLTEILPGFFGMTIKMGAAAMMIVVMIPGIAYILLPAGAAALLFAWGLRRQMKTYHKAVQESDGRLRVFLQERLGGMMVVRAFRGEHAVEKENAWNMKKHQQARMKRNTASNLCNVGFAVLMNGLYVVSFIYCGCGILTGSITPGTLLAVIQLVGQIQTPLTGLSGIVSRFYSMLASAERLMEAELFDREPYSVPWAEKDFSRLILEHVCFAYPNGEKQEVLSDVNLQLAKGDFVALTGHSGVGKSTLFKLLLHLYEPTEGQIFVCSHRGERVPLTMSHRGLFAYVPQGNMLMSGTIREVVVFGDEDKTDDERIAKALEIACADGFAAELEQGIDTLLGEKGAGLSEGQLQRLAIARAVYADAPVILLDEATSALDEATERQVLENLKSMTDKTVLIVTHRPAALEFCNRMIELNEGRTQERN